MWHAVEVLKIAAELPGGLTRPNIVLAMWSFEGRFPFAAGPLTAQWPDDLALIDELAPLVYDVGQRRWLLPGADGS